MGAFLEERLPIGVRLGASWADSYAVEITATAGGQEHRALTHPFPARRIRVSYTKESATLYSQLLALYHRAYGRFAGFRAQAIDDQSTNGQTGAPTAFDQLLEVITAGSIYQLQKAYGTGGTPLDIGLPVRTLFKPVAGSTVVGIRNTTTGDHAITAWTVDTTTGRVTMAANKSRAITAITAGATTVLTVGSHTFTVGDSVHVSGVSGMTQINGRRAAVTATGATSITVAIDSSAFSAYTSGGTAQTQPQTGETVYGGCRFDLPCRFDSVIDVTPVTPNWSQTGEIELVELLNP